MNTLIKNMVYPQITRIGKKVEKHKFSREPIIIGACPRSGTTLLLSIISSYPRIHAIKNQTYAFTQWKNSDPERIDRLYREFLFHHIAKLANRWCEKTPKNIQYVEEIFSYFGDRVRFINVIRDGRDVITSKHPRNKPDKYWVSSERWINDIKKSFEFSHYKNFLNIRYENLILEFDKEVEKISKFLNESHIPPKKNWIDQTSIKKSKHLKNRIQNIYTSSIGRWKNKEHENIITKFMQNKQAVSLMKKLKYIKD